MEKISRGNKTIIFLTVREMIELHRKGILSLELFANDQDIQRNDVWGKAGKNDYIDTLFHFGEGLSVIYAVDRDGVLQIEDGKQKLTTILGFVKDEFKLAKMRLVNGEDISNKAFSELSAELQEQFLDAELEIKVFSYETDEQVAEIFVKLNGGEKLRPMEKMRANLSKHIPFLGDITNTEFFSKVLKFSPSLRNRFADVDLALGYIMEEFNPGIDQNKARKQKFVEDLKGFIEITEGGKKKIVGKLSFLNDVFSGMFESKDEEKEVRSHVLSQSNRVILYKIAEDCIKAKYNPQKVYEFLKDYFINRGYSYIVIAGTTSTSNKSSLDKRYSHMKTNLKKFMK
jgi:hypothetical protein